MPNWCNNNLKVVGGADEMKRFYEIGIKDGKWRMSNYYPIPLVLKNTISPSPDTPERMASQRYTNEWEVKATIKWNEEHPEDQRPVPELVICENNTLEKQKALVAQYGTDNWYDWNIMNWGTKWDCSTESFNQSETEFSCSFESAWSPPEKWLWKVQELFPHLYFKLTFMEEGCGFAGMLYTDEDGGLESVEGDIYYYNADTEERCRYENSVDEDGKETDYVGVESGDKYTYDEVSSCNSCDDECVWFE